jgi:SET domain-containing protein
MQLALQSAVFPLWVRASSIDRRGVFSAATIPARRKVVQYTGEKIPLAEAVRRARRILFGKRKGPKRLYLARLNRGWVLDGAVGGCGAEFINHSCDPNLFVRKSDGQIHFYSKKRIGKGQELTIDYRFGPSPNPIACHCGSRKCRGTINRKT